MKCLLEETNGTMGLVDRTSETNQNGAVLCPSIRDPTNKGPLPPFGRPPCHPEVSPWQFTFGIFGHLKGLELL